MLPISIIYEDEHVLAVNKPAGLAVHEDGRTQEPVLTDWVRKTYPGIVGVGESMTLQNGTMIDRPGVVHRLDRDTSGVLVLAKTQGAFEFLKEQFKSRNIEKVYRAFVYGELTSTHGSINKPIGRSSRDFRLWSTGNVVKGKVREATTRWVRIAAKNNFSYVSLEPKTGRTHQLRVHMKSIGHAVVCDKRYAPKKECALGFERLALHAHSITLGHPDGSQLILEAPLPEDFRNAEKLILK